VTRVPL